MLSDSELALTGIRANIDRLDLELVQLLSDREQLVRQAGQLKSNVDAVRAPDRVEAVIARVCSAAEELGASPIVVERTYRAMISAFVELELNVHHDPTSRREPSR